jgi:tight adherence protein C
LLTSDALLLDVLIVALAAVLGLLLAHLGSLARASASDAATRRRADALAKSAVLRLLDPLVVGFAALVAKVRPAAGRARTEKLLVQAGNPWGYSADEFTGLCAAWAVVTFALGVLLFSAAYGEPSLVLPLFLAVGAYLLTASTLSSAVRRRRVEIDRRMPFFLDIVGLTMGAGAAFLESCETAIGGPSPGALEEEIGLVLREVSAGAPLRDALTNLSKRTASEEVSGFVSSVLQGEELGTPLVQIFENQSGMNRYRRTKAAEQAAAKIPNRMAVPTVLLMLAVLILLFGPIIVKSARGGMF